MKRRWKRVGSWSSTPHDHSKFAGNGRPNPMTNLPARRGRSIRRFVCPTRSQDRHRNDRASHLAPGPEQGAPRLTTASWQDCFRWRCRRHRRSCRRWCGQGGRLPAQAHIRHRLARSSWWFKALFQPVQEVIGQRNQQKNKQQNNRRQVKIFHGRSPLTSLA